MTNIRAFPLPRPNDYRVIVYSGGSGAGKTTAGQNVVKTIKGLEGQNFGYHSKAVAVYTFVIPKHMPINVPYPEGYSETHRPPDNIDDNTTAGQMLSLGIACSYFFRTVDAGEIDRLDITLDLIMRSFDSVIDAIRNHQNLTPTDLLILVVQLDEFQVCSRLFCDWFY